MNGKDIFLGLKYVGDDLIEKAEYGRFPTKKEITATQKKRTSIRRPFLIAAIIAMMLLLVGCAIVYVLSMQEIKLGEQEVTYDVYDFDPQSGEALAYMGQESMTQQVLTLAGLSNTPAAKAAREWYEFEKNYDPDLEIKRSIWGNIPDFGNEYNGYDIYTQEMKDKLDEILDKYGLMLRGKKIEFKTNKLMFNALGMESVLNPGSEALIDVEMASYYENGNFNLFFMYDLPVETGDSIHSQGSLYYRNKDCFIPDTAVLTEAEWEEWNYTTSSGDEVLILRSEEAASAWFFSDLPNYTTSLRMDIVTDVYEEKEDGIPVAKFLVLEKEQLERIADTFDFSLEPKLVDGWEELDHGAVGFCQEINGYRIDGHSVFTDGFGYQIVLKITAPENVDLTTPLDHTFAVGPGDGVRGRAQDDGDGKMNTCYYVLGENTRTSKHPEDGSFVYPKGLVLPIYWEDMHLSYYDTEKNVNVDTLLCEGTWELEVPLDNADTRQIELLTQPVTAKACTGWRMDGTDVIEEREITSIKLRSLGVDLSGGEQSDDFFCFTGQFSYIVMEDGSKVEFTCYALDEPIDLDKVVYVQIADGTVLPVPGREEEAQRLISEEVPVPEETMPVFTDGVELLQSPITMKHLGGWASDATGDMDPLYEYFTVNSITIHPWGLCIYCPSAFDTPDSEAVVTMKDGRSITLTGNNGAPYGPEPMNQLVSDITMDLSQVEKILLPDGTQLQMPTK